MYIRVEDKNLLDYSDWSTDLSGSTVNFLEYVDKSYNYRVFDTDPFGNTTPIWKTTSSGLSGWTGGIVAAPSVCGVNIDNTKIYRFSTWTKRKKIGINGRFYFGVRSLNNCSQDYLIRINDGLSSKNFYLYDDNFSNLNTSMPEDIWVLVVGYVLPSTYTGSTDTNYYSKIYNIDGGNTATSPYNYKWSGTTNAVYFRTYGPYNETSLSAETYSCYPRIDLLDGTEPSIATLLKNEGMWRSGTTYIKVEDQNLLDYKNWSGLTCGDVIDTNGSYWKQYGTTNCRIIDKDPFNNDNVLWRCATTGATTYGGFNISTGNFQYIDCDPTQDYRFSCWFNRKSINNTKPGGFYFGMWATSGTTALNVQDKISTNYTNTPYPVNKSTIVNTNQGEWYLAVGYLYKTGTPTGGTVNSAIYNISGTKITGYTYQDFINNPLVTDISIKFAPIYGASGCTVDLAYPRIDLIDGTEPSINTLLQNEGMWRSGTTMIYVDDGWKNI